MWVYIAVFPVKTKKNTSYLRLATSCIKFSNFMQWFSNYLFHLTSHYMPVALLVFIKSLNEINSHPGMT